jgi:uncharacterized protein involved in exopolysaccharide biosynthesis
MGNTATLTPLEILSRVVWPKVRILASRWRTLVVAGIVGAALGIVIHFVRPKSFRSHGLYVLLAPQQSSSNLSSLGTLATEFGLGDLAELGGDAGLNLNTLAEMARSQQILLEVVSKLDEIAASDPRVREPWYDFADPPDERSPKRLETLADRQLANLTEVFVDTRSRTLALGAIAPSRELSYALAEAFARVLDSLATDLLSRQVRVIREEAERQATEAEAELLNAEQRLQTFLSENRIISAPSLEFQARQLEREANLRTMLYSQLAGRMGEARIEEKRSTPAFITISPPLPPIRPQGVGGRALLVLGGFFGFAGTAVYSLWTTRSRQDTRAPPAENT